MKNKVTGGFLNYLFIFLGLIAGVVVVLMAILLLSPGTEIFGYKFLNNNNNVVYRTLPSSQKTLHQAYIDGDFDTIQILPVEYTIGDKEYSSGKYTINVERIVSVSALTIDIQNHAKGFTNVDMANKTEYIYTLSDKTLNLSIRDAYYKLALSNNVKINIYIPNTEYYKESKLNLDLKTSSGDINIGNKLYSTNFVSLKAESTSGDIELSNQVDISTDVNLKSDEGDLLIKNNLNNVTSVQLNSSSGKISTMAINGDLSIISEKSVCEINGNVQGDLQYSAQYGLIKAQDVGGSFYATESVKVSEIILKNVAGDVTFSSGKSSNVTIDEVGRVIYIKTESGNINIKNITGNFNHEIITKTGDVSYVNNSSGSIVVKTEKGKINAEYKKLDKVQNIENKSGKTNITISKSLPTKINLTTSGDIVCNFLGGEVKTGNYMQELNNPTELQVINVTATNGGDIFFTEKVS